MKCTYYPCCVCVSELRIGLWFFPSDAEYALEEARARTRAHGRWRAESSPLDARRPRAVNKHIIRFCGFLLEWKNMEFYRLLMSLSNHHDALSPLQVSLFNCWYSWVRHAVCLICGSSSIISSVLCRVLSVYFYGAVFYPLCFIALICVCKHKT